MLNNSDYKGIKYKMKNDQLKIVIYYILNTILTIFLILIIELCFGMSSQVHDASL